MKKRLLSLLLVLVMVLGMLPVTTFAAEGPVSVTADGEAVTVSKQGDYSDSQWGWYSIPVYYAQVPEDATFSIECSGGADATYRPSDGYLGSLSELQGMTKDSLQSYFTTAGNYDLTTTNNVAYIEITDYYYSSIYGVLIEFVPASDGGGSGSGDDSASFISVTTDGEACELSVHGTYVSSAANMTNEIQVYKVSATEGAAIVINKLADDGGDALGSARCAFSYGGTAGRAVYPVSVDSSYAVGDDAKTKFGLTTTNTVYYIEIGGQTRIPLYGLLIEFVPAETSEQLTGITGTASSTDTNENLNVGSAFDGDYNTYWATAAGGSLEDSYLIADLHGTYTINKVEYTMRYDSNALYNCTGNLLNYVIEVSTDGKSWTKVSEGTTIDGTTAIEFTPVQAAYVRLTSTSSYHWSSDLVNTVMCVAELAVYGVVTGGSDTPAPTTYTVTLPTGEGYAASVSGESASPVAAGGSYSFTITVADGYEKTDAFAVNANDILLTETDGVYTIADIQVNQTITVVGVEKKAVPLISVTAGGEATELTTLGNYESSIRFKTDEIPVYMVSADEGETIVVSKGANGDGASLTYRRLWKYGANSDNYTEVDKNGFNFPVDSTYAINSNSDAMAKFDLTTSNPVYYVEIGTSSEGTPLYGLLVEVIPAVPANSYTVTLPEGEGYTATASAGSTSPVEEGGNYSFTVAVVYGYDGTNMVVKANDTELTAIAAMFVNMLLWFGCYNKVLTSDKFTSLFGDLIPAISLLLVMVLRLVPNFIRKTQQIIGARKSIGKGAGETATTKEKLNDGMTVLGALTSWALEGSVVTGDSMRARGYGAAKRSSFMLYRMRANDWLLAAVMAVLLILTVAAACFGQVTATFTPALDVAPVSWGIIAYTGYLLIPTALHIKEAIQWHISKSKI